MKLFNLFNRKSKKEERHFDPLDIRVIHLENDYLFDYELTTWQVVKMAEYDWGDNFFTREFTVKAGNQTRFLHIEEDDKLIVSWTEEIKWRTLGDKVINSIKNNGEPPKEFEYKGVLFYLDEVSPGYYRETNTDEWEELIAYDYVNADETLCLSIDQWGEDDYEASYGKIIKENQISNILPIYND